MDVGIVGAGIAGLGAAIALLRAGHTVEMYEKSVFKKEVGAAITLTPNGNRVLRRWKFVFEKARPVDFTQCRYVNAESMDVTGRIGFEGVEEEFGERFCAYHRVDLHSGLRDLAEKYGVTIRLGAEVINIEPEEGIIEILGGEKAKKDLWILADGCHTPFLPKIAEEDIPTVKIGKSMYRWLTPMDKLLSHPSTAASWTNESPGFVFFSKGALTVITYPCRNNTLLNCALVHPTRPSEQHKDSWNSPSDHANVLELLEGCHDVVRSLPLAAEEIKVYTMTQRPPSSRISRGNMLCIGDTTHHMLPTHAQGGSQALEDAAALEILFSTSTSSLSSPYTHTPANLTSRLKLYKLLRLPRSATTQILSSTHPDYTLSNVNKKTAEIRRFYQGELPDWPLGVDRFSKPLKDFFWSYDVFEQAGRAVKWWDEEGQNKRVENGKEMEIPVGCFKWFGTLSGESQIKKPSNLVFE